MTTGGEPYGDIADVARCRSFACSAPCGLHCGNVPPLVDPAIAQECDACLSSECCAEFAACGESPDCRRIVECVRNRSTPDGVQACQNVHHPAGSDVYFAMDSCVHTRCAVECAYGNNWTCQVRAAVARPAADELTMTVRVLDAAQKGLQGIQARLCRGTDPTCASPVDEAISGADGRAQLTASTVTTTGRAPVDGLILLHDPAGGRLETIVNLFPPLSETGIEFPSVIASEAEQGEVARLLGETVDPSRGQIIATVVDCAFRRARGVRVTVEPADPATRVYYCMGTIPLRNGSQTDAFGNALVVNATPGTTTLVATAADGQEIGRTPVIVAAGTLSIAMLAPTAR